MLLLWQLQNCFEKMWGIFKVHDKTSVIQPARNYFHLYQAAERLNGHLQFWNIKSLPFERCCTLHSDHARVTSKWTALSVIGTILILVLQPYHSHDLSSQYIIFIMKAQSDSIWKGRDKKIPNSLTFLNTNRQAHTLNF